MTEGQPIDHSAEAQQIMAGTPDVIGNVEIQPIIEAGDSSGLVTEEVSRYNTPIVLDVGEAKSLVNKDKQMGVSAKTPEGKSIIIDYRGFVVRS